MDDYNIFKKHTTITEISQTQSSDVWSKVVLLAVIDPEGLFYNAVLKTLLRSFADLAMCSFIT